MKPTVTLLTSLLLTALAIHAAQSPEWRIECRDEAVAISAGILTRNIRTKNG